MENFTLTKLGQHSEHHHYHHSAWLLPTAQYDFQQELDVFSFIQEVCKEADDHEPAVRETLKAGDELLQLCTEEDAKVVTGKVNKLKDLYRNQLRLSKDMRKKFAEASELSSGFFGANEELTTWLDDTRGKLEEAQKEGQEAEEQQERLKVC